MNYKKITLILFLGIFLSGERKANAQSMTFSYTGALQTWTVPCTTVITVTANGAQGGTGSLAGGLGAKIVGTFTVNPGDVMDIVVGQEGLSNNEGSGGGGSFVWNSGNDTLLVAAAGGGGSYQSGQGGAGSGTSTPTAGTGPNGSSPGGSGGQGGQGGSCTSSYAGGGGGCGWLTAGGVGASCGGYTGGAGGDTPIGGAAGGGSNVGNGCTYSSAGGYGGGGASTCYASGGGGGYNGGGGALGFVAGGNGAGGGGSYNGGTNQNNITGSNSGNGSVTINWTVSIIPVTASGHVIANEVTCDGLTGEANAVTTGVALVYSWSNGETKDTATGLSAGSYTVNVSSACGGSASAAVTITQPANVVTVSAIPVTNVFCNGGHDGSASATVNGVGSPYTYSWTPSGETTATATSLTAGTYVVQVSNICGATASTTVTITQPAPLSLSSSVTANVLCYGGNNGSAFATANSGTPPYAYSWAPYGGITDSAVALTAEGYTITLTDANGCTGSASVSITQPNVLTTSASIVSNVLCNGGHSGSATSAVAGGIGPYTYAWTGGQSNATASGLVIGTYTVDITDANGCTASSRTTLTQPSPVNVVEQTTLDSGACTGSAWIAVDGGVTPYTYAWSNGSTSYYLHYVCHDTFCYRVTDGNGCKDSGCVVVPTDLGVGGIYNNAGNLKVYPNPNSGQFTIESSLATGGEWTVEVYNVLGEKVYTQLATLAAPLSVNLSSQPNGIYLYRIISSDNGNLLGEGKIEITK